MAAPIQTRNAPWGYRIAKRALDIVISGFGLIALSPVFLAIALAVKLSSRGPVLYRWRVVGKGGTPFVGYKFRTMVQNADDLKEMLAAQNEMSGPVFKMRDDPRITPVGKVLRKYSLDELPQLWSVFKGDMSLVGPRPPLRSEFAEFNPRQRSKLAVKPGITCLWQISGRSDITDFEEWIDLDLQYIQERSLWLDIGILAKTIDVVLRGQGAR